MQKSESEVAQSCPTLNDPIGDCSLPGSSIHGIFQARVLEPDNCRQHKCNDVGNRWQRVPLMDVSAVKKILRNSKCSAHLALLGSRFRGGGCGKGAMKTRNCCRVHLWTTTQLLTSWATNPNSSLFPPQSKRVSNAKDLLRENRLFTTVLPKWGPWISSINITWELVGSTDSQAPPDLPNQKPWGLECFLTSPSRPSGAGYSLRTTHLTHHFLLDLEMIILSELSQKEKDRCHMMWLICRI